MDKITVRVNNNETELASGLTVENLLISRNSTKAAVWVNGKQLLKAEYSSRIVEQGDELRILRVVAGG
jgi:thiamine biosynthesis protein ThiS